MAQGRRESDLRHWAASRQEVDHSEPAGRSERPCKGGNPPTEQQSDRRGQTGPRGLPAPASDSSAASASNAERKCESVCLLHVRNART
eukprot:12663506-Alexandrium_andersonii.AAC.1